MSDLLDLIKENIVTIIVAILGAIVSLIIYNDNKVSEPKVKVLGGADFINRQYSLISPKKFNLLQEKFPSKHEAFTDLGQYLNDANVKPQYQGFVMDELTNDNMIALFCITSDNGNRTLDKLASVIEIEFDNIKKIKNVKFKKLNIIWSKTPKQCSTYENLRVDGGKNEIKACYGLQNSYSPFYLLLYEVYDEISEYHWWCNHHLEIPMHEVRYEEAKFYFSVTTYSIIKKNRYYEVTAEKTGKTVKIKDVKEIKKQNKN